MMNVLLTNIETLMDEFKTDATLRVEKGNKAAGARARKASLELTRLFKEFRKLSVKEGME